jgi:hypothetical protein
VPFPPASSRVADRVRVGRGSAAFS